MEMVYLNDVFEFVRNGASIKQSDEKKGFPITRIETIWNETIDVNRFGYADLYEDDLKKYEKYLMQDGDILMTHINSPKHLGKCALYNSVPDKLIHGMNLLCLRPNKEISHSSFLKYYFNSTFFKTQLPKISNQSVNQASFSAGNLKKLKIPLPPLAEQKRIAAILNAADSYRQQTQQTLDKYNQLAQAIFLDMFGDPLTNPMGWEKIKLGQITSMKAGKFISAKDIYSEMNDELYPCYGGNGLRGFVESFTHDGDFVLIGRQGALCGNVKIASGVFHATEHAVVCSPIMDYETIWLYFLLDMMNLNRYATGAAQPGLNVGTLVKLNVIFPTIQLQNKFADKIANIEAQKVTVQQELAHANNLFNALLQKAFKGEL